MPFGQWVPELAAGRSVDLRRHTSKSTWSRSTSEQRECSADGVGLADHPMVRSFKWPFIRWCLQRLQGPRRQLDSARWPPL